MICQYTNIRHPKLSCSKNKFIIYIYLPIINNMFDAFYRSGNL